MRSRLCRACRDFHDLDGPWPQACSSHFKAYTGVSSIQIIKDISPYKAVAVDKRTGKVPVIKSRREHKEFLRSNGYVEVGNEPIRKTPDYEVQDSRRDIKQAMDKIRSEGRWK